MRNEVLKPQNFQPFVIVHKTGIKENNGKVRGWELGSTTSQPPKLLDFFAILVRLGEAERTQQKKMKKWVRRA